MRRIVTLLGDRREGTGLPTLGSSHKHKKTSLSPPSFLTHKYILKYQNAKIASTTMLRTHASSRLSIFFKEKYAIKILIMTSVLLIHAFNLSTLEMKVERAL